MTSKTQPYLSTTRLRDVFQQGVRDGLRGRQNPSFPFDPCPSYSGPERNAYAEGFDYGLESADHLLDIGLIVR